MSPVNPRAATTRRTRVSMDDSLGRQSLTWGGGGREFAGIGLGDAGFDVDPQSVGLG